MNQPTLLPIPYSIIRQVTEDSSSAPNRDKEEKAGTI